ncbi:hypothetical protein HHI36_003533 [Cryptolaemus montrouzieri]|uniref:Tudor domain-containing protein n=1 Tax=Cryptolaemus montrouzieri TaxID=559131 RepID=A0ABD2PE71_9CUCU
MKILLIFRQRKPVKNVEVGQVVLCMKEGEKQLCRAVVRTLDNGLVAVQFIDFQTLEVVSLENVYGISRKLANLPVALIESPIIKGYDANKFGPESESLIEKMVCQKSKLDVAKENGDFDLLLDDKSFSEMLFPSPNLKNTKEQTVGVTNVVKPDSMKEKALGNTLTSISSKDVDATIPIIKSTANKESATSISHLINFTKGKCFRGRVLKKLDNGKYNVGILEYEDQTKDNENIPGNESMIIECDLVFSDTEGVHKRLVELLKPNYIYEMNVLESENHKYALDIPDVRDSLMKEGLI